MKNPTKKIKQQTKVYQATVKDIYKILEVENAAWPQPDMDEGCIVASSEKFKNRINAGCVMKAVYEGEDIKLKNGYKLKKEQMIGVISYQIIKLDVKLDKILEEVNKIKEFSWKELVKKGFPENWYTATDNGYINKTHNPNGNTAFLIGVGVIPKIRGAQMVNKLINSVLKDVKYNKWKKDWVIGYARVPQYCKNRNIPLNEYVKKTREDGKLFDYGLRFHENNGAKVVCEIPYSMDPEDDLESLGCGALAIYNLKELKI